MAKEIDREMFDLLRHFINEKSEEFQPIITREWDWEGRACCPIVGNGNGAGGRYRCDDPQFKAGQGTIPNDNLRTRTPMNPLKALVYAQLSGNQSWQKIQANEKNIDAIFCNFDKQKLLAKLTPAGIDGMLNQIKAINCGSITTKTILKFLEYNIHQFEEIESQFGSIICYIFEIMASNQGTLGNKPKDYLMIPVVEQLAKEFKGIGIPLACEFLKNMGFDMIKPDVHICRIMPRLGLVSITNKYPENNDFKNVIAAGIYLKHITGLSLVEIDWLLWSYCAKGMGETCTKTPKCSQCVIRDYCVNPGWPTAKQRFVVRKIQ